MHGAHLLASGIRQSAASDRKSASHSWAGGAVLLGQVEDAHRTDMMPLVITGNRIQEASASGGSNNYWYAKHPTDMGTLHYRATMTVGNQSSGTNRGALVWVGGKGTNGIENSVWFRVRGQGGLACVIATKTGLGAATITAQVTGANILVSPGDTIGLEVYESAPGSGIYVYQGYRNGIIVPSAIWTDSTGIFGVPGKGWGGGGYGTYSGGYFPSLGMYAMEAADL
jgi:hypothetical protein